MDRTENIELAALCMIYNMNNILVQIKVKGDWKGYTFPGGHIEKGESIIDGIIREIKEETGLTILRPQLCGIKQFPIKNGRYLVFLFKTNKFEGELVSSDEGEMIWIDRDELSKARTVDDFYQLLYIFDNENFTEVIYTREGDKWEIR